MRFMLASTTEEGNISTIFGVWKEESHWHSRRKIFLSRNISSCAAEQFIGDASLEPVNRRVLNNSKPAERRKVMSTRYDRHLIRMAVNDRTASSKKLAARWSSATSVLIPSLIRRYLLHSGLCAKESFLQNPTHGKSSTAASAVSSYE